MNNILYLVFFFCLSFAICTSSGLFGLSEDVQLVSIDPTSYKVITIGDKIENITQAQSLATIDNARGIFYFVGYDNVKLQTVLIGLLLKDGSIASNVVLPLESYFYVGAGQTCDVDPNTGDVIVTGRDASKDDDHNVLRVNPSTLSIKSLNTFPGTDILGGFSAYDSIHNLEYLEMSKDGVLTIYAYNTVSGELASQRKVSTLFNIQTLVFDPTSGLFYGIGRNTSSGDAVRTLLSYNGITGEYKQISALPGYYLIKAGETTLDVKGRRLFVFMTHVNDQNNYELVSINIDSGKIIASIPACADAAVCPWNVEYYNGP